MLAVAGDTNEPLGTPCGVSADCENGEICVDGGGVKDPAGALPITEGEGEGTPGEGEDTPAEGEGEGEGEGAVGEGEGEGEEAVGEGEGEGEELTAILDAPATITAATQPAMCAGKTLHVPVEISAIVANRSVVKAR